MTVPELATRYAALVALTDALAAEKNRASSELRKLLAENGVMKGAVATQFGTLTLKENKGSTVVRITDEDALIGWCEENSPESLEHLTRVRANDRDQIVKSRFVPVGGKVVDSLSGEVVEFAVVDVTEPSAPTPTYGQTDEQVATKQLAVQYVAERTTQLTEHLRVSVAAALEPPDYDKLAGE